MSLIRNSSRGRIITFYSYKGGTGRTMALANVAWVLASNGWRVLCVDWDLEAPGLHRYFKPFLWDPELREIPGVIDVVWDHACDAMSQPSHNKVAAPELDTLPEWAGRRAKILKHATSLRWDFEKSGRIDFLPAGRQDAGYAARVNTFDWQSFYSNLGGGEFLESLAADMREQYDVVLVDSRTGVSDTSGICTVHLPDTVVVCFTLNDQSILGASRVARSMAEQKGGPDFRVFPVPTRVDEGELDRADARREMARSRFKRFLWHLPPASHGDYWGQVEVKYIPYYAYEEVLATFRDSPHESGTMLEASEALASYLTAGGVAELRPPDSEKRRKVLANFRLYEARRTSFELDGLAEYFGRSLATHPGSEVRRELAADLANALQPWTADSAADVGNARVARQLAERGFELLNYDSTDGALASGISGLIGLARGAAESVGDRMELARLAALQGLVHGEAGERELALASHAQAIELFRELGCDSELAEEFVVTARHHESAGMESQARSALDQALCLFTSLGDATAITAVLADLVRLAREAHDWKAALRHQADLARRFREDGDVVGEASAQAELSELHKQAGDSNAAQESSSRALELLKRIAGLDHAASVQGQLGSSVAGARSEPLRVFLSYAHEDDAYRIELERVLKPLESARLIYTWYDRKILPGDDWSAELASQVGRADLILVLCSSDLLSSQWLKREIIKRAWERHEKGEARLVPIRLRPCKLEAPLTKLQSLPRGGADIVSAPDRAQAWASVARDLLELIREWHPRPTDPPNAGKSDSELAYLELVAELHSHVDIRGMGAQVAERLSLRDVYTPVRVRASSLASDEDRSERLEAISGRENVVVRDLGDVLRARRHVALVGDAGAGKTTALRHVALTLAECRLGSASQEDRASAGAANTPPVPVFVRLPDYAESIWERGLTGSGPGLAGSLLAYLDLWAKSQPVRLPDGWLSERVRRGGCFLLLDGLDEVPGDDLRRHVAQVATDFVALCQ